MTTVRTFADLAAEIHALPPRLGDVRLVTVDGPSGAGKSTFASHAVSALEHRGSVALVGIEALYEGWTLDGAWQRLDEAVLEPLAAGWAGGFHPYDWATHSWSPRWCTVALSQVLVVEGCGSSPRAADRLASYRIWIEAPPEVAWERGRSREGVDLDRRLRDWQRLESAHFAEQDTRHRADLHVIGEPAVPLLYDPAMAFSVLS